MSAFVAQYHSMGSFIAIDCKRLIVEPLPHYINHMGPINQPVNQVGLSNTRNAYWGSLGALLSSINAFLH